MKRHRPLILIAAAVVLIPLSGCAGFPENVAKEASKASQPSTTSDPRSGWVEVFTSKQFGDGQSSPLYKRCDKTTLVYETFDFTQGKGESSISSIPNSSECT